MEKIYFQTCTNNRCQSYAMTGNNILVPALFGAAIALFVIALVQKN